MAIRYSGLPTYIQNGKQFYFSAPALNSSLFVGVQTTLFQVSESDRLDKISFDFYDRGDLGWLILCANNLAYPTDIFPGMMLNIPLDYKSCLQAISHLNGQQVNS